MPASTMRPSGTRPDVLSNACAAPAVITPGNVQFAIGKGRSIAPVARITLAASVSAAAPATETPSSSAGVRLQTPAPGTYCAPLAKNSSTSFMPCE